MFEKRVGNLATFYVIMFITAIYDRMFYVNMVCSARALLKHIHILKRITPFDYDFIVDSQLKRISFSDLLVFLQNNLHHKREKFVISCSLVDVYELIKKYSLIKCFDYNGIEDCTYSDTHHAFSKNVDSFVICKRSTYGNRCYNLNIRNCYIQAIVNPKSYIYKKSLNLNKIDEMDLTKLVFFDIETTGLNEFEDDILEIAFYDYESGEYYTRKLPLRKRNNIPEEISNLNHITNEMVKDTLPLNQDEVEQLIKKFSLDEKYVAIWTGNNLFDAVFLKIYFLDNDLTGFDKLQFINIKQFIKDDCKFISNDYSKDYIASCFGISIDKAHNALEDCKIEAEIVSRIVNKTKNLNS